MQDPNSEKYVPFPYPKTRAEIVADFKHAVERSFGPPRGWQALLSNYNPGYGERLLLKVLEESSCTRVTGIERVANRTNSVAGDFLFLIEVRDRQDRVVAYSSLTARGEHFGGSLAAAGKFLSPQKTRAQVLKAFARVLRPFQQKTLARIFMGNPLAPYPFSPTWELVTEDRETYYLDPNGTVYRLQRTLDNATRRGFSPGNPPAGKADLVVHESRTDRSLFLDRL